MYCVHTVPVNIFIYEGEATRLAELALIFIPIYNVALSDSQFRQTCCLPFIYTVHSTSHGCMVHRVLCATYI